jgi:hypothetical protein
MAMLDACERYVTELAAAYARYDHDRDTPDSAARYRLTMLALGHTLGHEVRQADRENPTDGTS